MNAANMDVMAIASGHVIANATIAYEECGFMLAQCLHTLREGGSLSQLEVGALNCLAGQLIGEAMKFELAVESAMKGAR